MGESEQSKMSRIRHVATSHNGNLVAVGAFERRIAIWNIKTLAMCAEFDSSLDFGGERLAISPNNQFVVAGAYRRLGISCHEAKSGKLLWQRKDLKKVQHISTSIDSMFVYCGFEAGPACALSITTGDLLGKTRALKRTYVSPYDQLLMHEHRSQPLVVYSLTEGKLGELSKTTFALLDATFSPDALVISEVGGPIRCFELMDLRERWRMDQPDGIHAIKMTFAESQKSFLAVQWAYKESGEHSLITLDPKSGKTMSSLMLPAAFEFGFCKKGSLLLTNDGTLLDTTTCKPTSKLAFPDPTVF